MLKIKASIALAAMVVSVGVAGAVGSASALADAAACSKPQNPTTDSDVECVFPEFGNFEWTVPTGVTSITAELYGAEGGDGQMAPRGDSSLGGKGGRVKADLAVTAGEKLQIIVGGKGGYGPFGGGYNYGGASRSYGGGGGGESDIIINGQKVLIAGAGGGAGSYQVTSPYGSAVDNAGGDGGKNGSDGKPSDDWGKCGSGNHTAGCGGTSTTGGAGGTSGYFGFSSAGGLGFGGIGAFYSGGGGGGYYGGGGGSIDCSNPGLPGSAPVCPGGGGGGGSSYAFDKATNVSFTTGVRLGSGQITLSYKSR